MNFTSLSEIAAKAVDLGAEILTTHDPGDLTAKGDRDYASEVDYLVEQRLRDYLSDATPNIDVIGEETGADVSDGEHWWALDPIDGTVNFAHGLPLCGISLGLIQDQRPVLGVIDFPFFNTRFTGAEGQGSYCDQHRITVSSTTTLRDSLVTIGDFAVGDGADAKNHLRLAVAEALAGRALRVRMLGSAALDLAWLAAGRTDASITLSNRPWDVAAGVIIAREAGANVFDLDGIEHYITSTATLAAPRGIAGELIDLLSPLAAQVSG